MFYIVTICTLGFAVVCGIFFAKITEKHIDKSTPASSADLEHMQ